MLDVWSRLCLGFVMICLSGACERPAEKVPVPLLDYKPLDLYFGPGVNTEEWRENRQAKMSRAIEDWQTSAAEEAWDLFEFSDWEEREEALSCQPAFEVHFKNRLHGPDAFALYPHSLRVGVLDNGIRLGTIKSSVEERDKLVFREIILFRLDTCDIFLVRPARDRVQLYDGTGQETARKRLSVEWLNSPASTKFSINSQRNIAAVFVPVDMVSADLDLSSADQCRFDDIAGAADHKLTLDKVCPREAITITPIEVISQLWLIRFGEDDMEAYLASKDHPYATLMDASRRPGLQTPYLSEFYATVLPGPAADVRLRPEDMRALYPLSPRAPEEN